MKNTKILIAPSILSADFAAMGDAVRQMTQCGADIIHCDVMDGMFVPNITFGPKMVRDIRKHTDLPLDVHLMIADPNKYADAFMDAGADYLSFHIEAGADPIPLLRHIRDRNVKSGIVISPDTDIVKLSGILQYADMALLMSVYPGFGGQKFIEKSLSRMEALRKLRDNESPNTLLEIDGGINLDNINAVLQSGANVIVAGQTVFAAEKPAEIISALRGDL